jgi:3-oxoacyl-[acyl-carrier protein] reductase
VRADVRKPAEVRKLFDAAIERYTRVDILINNAGALLYKTIAETSDQEFDQILSSNVKSVFYALREAATRLSLCPVPSRG